VTGLGPSDANFERLRAELFKDILSNPSFTPPVDDRMRALQEQYRKTQADVRAVRERQRRETILSEELIGSLIRSNDTTPRTSVRFGYSPADFRSGRGADIYDRYNICAVCGQDKRYVQYCAPRRSDVPPEDKAHRLNFDSDTVIDGEVLDGVVELDRAPDVD